jgi:hypothetical protein
LALRIFLEGYVVKNLAPASAFGQLFESCTLHNVQNFIEIFTLLRRHESRVTATIGVSIEELLK